MPDVVDAATRSRMMSGIKGKNTKPELRTRSLLHRRGFRFRLHVRGLPGKPDIVLPKYRAVILVNGCFWHGHDCPLFKWPQSRPDWWRAKIERNRSNDARDIALLKNLGWRVGVVWECALKGTGRLTDDEVGDALALWLKGVDSTLVIRGYLDGQGKTV